MPNQQTDQLFQLIKSLTKAEKRNFKLFAKRGSANDDLKFILLFDAIEKQTVFDEEQILKKVKTIKKAQLSNLKAHLYKQLLTSLRLSHSNHNIDIQIRENIDYARILYNKGLYKQSLKLLEKTKTIALDAKQTVLCLEIVQFEKHIELHHITRSIKTRAEEISKESEEITSMVVNETQFSNLAIRLYGLYLKVGFIRNEKDYVFITEFFNANLPDYNIEELGVFEKISLYQSYVWYYYIVVDFLNGYRYAQKWIDLFEEHPQLIKTHHEQYLKGLHNLLATLFNIGHYTKLIETLKTLENFENRDDIQWDKNEQMAYFVYKYSSRIDKHFLEGSFTEGVKLAAEIEEKLASHFNKIDEHRILVINYKIACLYFGSGDNKNTIKYLNKIINIKVDEIREDIHCFARILNLIAHFELQNDDLLEYQIKTVYRFLIKMNDLQQVQIEILNFLRRLSKINRNNLQGEFIKLKNKLVKLKDNPYENRPFLYLDIISWLQCKIEGKTVQEIIQNKFKLHFKEEFIRS